MHSCLFKAADLYGNAWSQRDKLARSATEQFIVSRMSNSAEFQPYLLQHHQATCANQARGGRSTLRQLRGRFEGNFAIMNAIAVQTCKRDSKVGPTLAVVVILRSSLRPYRRERLRETIHRSSADGIHCIRSKYFARECLMAHFPGRIVSPAHLTAKLLMRPHRACVAPHPPYVLSSAAAISR